VVTRTQTKVTHYETQKRRRGVFLDEWRKYRQTVVKQADVQMFETHPGVRHGVYMGTDGDRPTRTVDAHVHELDPGSRTSIRRHSWDVLTFCVHGEGWTEIDGVRYDWRAWDSLHIPPWAWYRHGNDGDRTARFLSYSTEPFLDVIRMAVLDDRGDADVADLPGRPEFSSGQDGADPYTRMLRRLAKKQEENAEGRIKTAYDELELLPTPRGTRTTFINDKAIGNRTSGITQAMLQFAPGKGQSMHRHPGEAWLYVVEGRGYSYLGYEPEGGETHEWEQGDLIVVDHYLWHQHFNSDPDRTARLVRIHMFDGLLETLKAILDPIPMFEEPAEALANAPDISNVVWPEDERPE